MKADYLKLVRESIDRMEQSMGGRLRMDGFAAAAHYSYPHFARVFSDVVGMPSVMYMARGWPYGNCDYIISPAMCLSATFTFQRPEMKNPSTIKSETKDATGAPRPSPFSPHPRTLPNR